VGGVAVLAAALFSGAQGRAVSTPVPVRSVPAAVTPAPELTGQYHYMMSARVRPLLFWIRRSNVGDAIVTRATTPQEARYSLLIGSDPDRAPRRINRWGYIEEKIRGDAATVVGLMTSSDEMSVEEAEKNLRMEGSGVHPFKVIHTTIDAEQSRSVVTTVGAPADYSFRQVRALLALASDGGTALPSRVVRLPRGTRPGFLTAIAEIIHAQAEGARAGTLHAGTPLTYVYHGKFYELRGTNVQLKPTVEMNSSLYARVVSAQFATKNLADGEETRFALSYAIDGRLAEVPLTISYQPRWWLQVNLVLTDDVDSPAESSLRSEKESFREKGRSYVTTND
jgi:hypothetical protein